MIDRYGEAIEADLQKHFGVRLLGVFTGERTPREVLNYVSHLPSDSAYGEAAAQDDELAKMMLQDSGEGSDGSEGPRLREFGQSEQMLATIIDRLGEIYAATVANSGQQPPRISPYPRPVTAADRVTQQLADEAYDYILAKVEAARAVGSSGG